jgi:RelE toxin of RelE / RelB toxin-antitoxin system
MEARRVGKAKRAHQRPRPGGHGAQERAFAHPTRDSNRPKSAVEECGKRGGARVIYFFHSANAPLFVLTAYAKNEQADLSQKDRNDFRKLTRLLTETYGRKKK